MQEELLKSVVGVLATSPFLALLAYLWLTERSKAIALQQRIDLLAERVIKGLQDATEAIKANTMSIEAIRQINEVVKLLLIARNAEDK